MNESREFYTRAGVSVDMNFE